MTLQVTHDVPFVKNAFIDNHQSTCHKICDFFVHFQIQLKVTPRVEGILKIVGVRWTLSDSVVGYQYFEFNTRKNKKGRKGARHSLQRNLNFIVIKVPFFLYFFDICWKLRIVTPLSLYSGSTQTRWMYSSLTKKSIYRWFTTSHAATEKPVRIFREGLIRDALITCYSLLRSYYFPFYVMIFFWVYNAVA